VSNASGVESSDFLENELEHQYIVNPDKKTIKMTHDIKDCTDL
jgi:hypothetical protein